MFEIIVPIAALLVSFGMCFMVLGIAFAFAEVYQYDRALKKLNKANEKYHAGIAELHGVSAVGSSD